jgi:hypothetical protein
MTEQGYRILVLVLLAALVLLTLFPEWRIH